MHQAKIKGLCSTHQAEVETVYLAGGDLEPYMEGTLKPSCGMEFVELSSAREARGQQEPTEEGTFKTTATVSVDPSGPSLENVP